MSKMAKQFGFTEAKAAVLLAQKKSKKAKKKHRRCEFNERNEEQIQLRLMFILISGVSIPIYPRVKMHMRKIEYSRGRLRP